MKTNNNRRNFLQKGMLMAAGLFSVKHIFSSSEAKAETKASNETLKTIHNLHTTHGNFSEKKIPQAQIEEIKQACIRAANSSNMQTYSIIEVQDKELMKNVCGYVGSHLLLFCVDYNRLIAGAEALELSYAPGHMTSFVTGSINASLAAQTAVIASRSLGLDSLLTNGIHWGNMDRQWELLNLPEKNCMPLIALVLGYADKKQDHEVGRLNGKEIFHQKAYQAPNDEELKAIMEKYDDPDLALGLNPNWKEQGYAHYQEWLHKKWLAGDSKPKTEDTALYKQLKKRGFVEMI